MLSRVNPTSRKIATVFKESFKSCWRRPVSVIALVLLCRWILAYARITNIGLTYWLTGITPSPLLIKGKAIPVFLNTGEI
jgi:type VI protein secretion system component VasK